MCILWKALRKEKKNPYFFMSLDFSPSFACLFAMQNLTRKWTSEWDSNYNIRIISTFRVSIWKRFLQIFSNREAQRNSIQTFERRKKKFILSHKCIENERGTKVSRNVRIETRGESQWIKRKQQICCWWGWLSLCILLLCYHFSLHCHHFSPTHFSSLCSQCRAMSSLFLSKRWWKNSALNLFHTTLFNNKCLNIFHL